MNPKPPKSENRLTPTASYDWGAPLVRKRIVQLVSAASVWSRTDTARDDVDGAGADAFELDALLALSATYGFAPNRYELEALEAPTAAVPPLAVAAVRWADQADAYVDVCHAADDKREALANLLIAACLLARALRCEPSTEPDRDQAFRHLAAAALGKALLP